MLPSSVIIVLVVVEAVVVMVVRAVVVSCLWGKLYLTPAYGLWGRRVV